MRFSWRTLMRPLRLNKWKRLVLLSTSLLAALLVIILGSSLYTARNTRQSIEYGGGTEYVVAVQTNDATINVDQIASEIYERIDRLGVVGATVSPEADVAKKFVRITYPGLTSPEQIAAVEREITAKPSLVFTDVWGNPLFTPSGNFDAARLTNTTSGPMRPLDEIDWVSGSQVPLVQNGVESVYQTSGYKLRVQFTLGSLAQWTAATSYLASLPEGSRQLIAWVNMGEFITLLKDTLGSSGANSLWVESGQDPFKAAHINNDINAPLRQGPNYLLSNVKDFLVTSTNVTQAQNTPYYVFDGAFSADETINWARELNFAIANYGLLTSSTTTLSPPNGSNALFVGLITALVLFALASLFLLFNYGLLGVVATLGLGLFTAVTLMLFTAMGGEYSPETMATFMLAFGLALDGCLVFFERLKSEAYVSKNFFKAHVAARRRSWALLDGNILVFVAGVCLFYFGAQNALGISVLLMLGSALALIIATGLVRLVSYWLVGLNSFNGREYLMGLHPKLHGAVQARIDKVNFVRGGRYYGFLLCSVIFAGFLLIVITSVRANNLNGALNLSAFEAKAIYQFNVTTTGATQLDDAKALLLSAGFSEANLSYGTLAGVINSVRATSADTVLIAALDPAALQAVWGSNYNFSVTSATLSIDIIRNAGIALGVASAIAIVYVTVRLSWTHALAIFISLVGEALLVISIFAFARLAINALFVSMALAALAYSLYTKVITMSRLAESLASHTSKYDGQSIKRLVNEGVAASLRRVLIGSGFVGLMLIILTALNQPLNLGEATILVILSISNLLATLLSGPAILVRLEIWRHRGIAYREQKSFWKTSLIEEQMIQGINDFEA